MDKLTGEVLRQHANAERSMAWESQARQLLHWAAELIDAADNIPNFDKSTAIPTPSSGKGE
jgi:hypothetical protein